MKVIKKYKILKFMKYNRHYILNYIIKTDMYRDEKQRNFLYDKLFLITF
ncbi:hypothetical protein [Hydrogenothermus marinus]|nr:hypothetical protein [Hydrogenothermus marinus]